MTEIDTPEPAAPGPGHRPILPRGAGGILAASLRLYRERAGALLALAAVFVVPSAVLGELERRASTRQESRLAPEPEVDGGPVPSGRERAAPRAEIGPADAGERAGTDEPPAVPAVTGRDLALRAVWWFLGAVFTGMLTAAVARAASGWIATGSASVARSAAYAFEHVLGLARVGRLAAALAAALLALALPALLLLSTLQGRIGQAGMVGASFALALPLAVVFVLTASLGIAAFAVEGRRGAAAVARAWALLRGSLWHGVATTVLVLVVGAGASLLAAWLGEVTGADALAGVGVATVVAPLEGLLAFFLYLDLRARQEALTLAKLAAETARQDAKPPAG